MTQTNQQDQKLKIFYSTIYKKYDLVNRLFTLGMDVRWRRKAAVECAKLKPVSILDLCCGTGDMVLAIRKKLPDVRIVGYDFSDNMLEMARTKAVRNKVSGVDFIQGDAAEMPFPTGEFDVITIAFGFRNLTYENSSCDLHVAEISRVIKSGGYFIILESAVPQNNLIRFFYNCYLRLFLIPLGGILSGNWKAYRYLARSSSNFFNRKELTELLNRYGLKVILIKPLFLGAASLLIASRE
jgi:demethylmenaquinone methyltransferase / 2-methoxy-6-polyprenyl-1,4-benzoquinol methylase